MQLEPFYSKVAIYSGNQSKIKTEGSLTQEIPLNKEIRQGDSLIPLIFNILMDCIIKEVRGMPGYPLDAWQINLFEYADDIILISNSEDNLQILLHHFSLACEKYEMCINAMKTKVLTVNKWPVRCKLQLRQNVIEQVMTFKYLGENISSDGFLKEVRKQVNKASAISGCLKSYIWKNKYLRRETKVRIYKTVASPIMTYAAETRSDTVKTKQILNVTEMNVLRKIQGKTRWDRVSNAEIRETCRI